jgi:hypothetical protein
MKKHFTFILFLALLLVISCQSPKQHLLYCDYESEELLEKISVILHQNEYSIVYSNADNGYLLAEKKDSISKSTKGWEFNIDNGILKGLAFIKTESNSLYQNPNSIDKDELWYWNIYEALEKMCGTKIEMIYRLPLI